MNFLSETYAASEKDGLSEVGGSRSRFSRIAVDHLEKAECIPNLVNQTSDRCK